MTYLDRDLDAQLVTVHKVSEDLSYLPETDPSSPGNDDVAILVRIEGGRFHPEQYYLTDGVYVKQTYYNTCMGKLCVGHPIKNEVLMNRVMMKAIGITV